MARDDGRRHDRRRPSPCPSESGARRRRNGTPAGPSSYGVPGPIGDSSRLCGRVAFRTVESGPSHIARRTTRTAAGPARRPERVTAVTPRAGTGGTTRPAPSADAPSRSVGVPPDGSVPATAMTRRRTERRPQPRDRGSLLVYTAVTIIVGLALARVGGRHLPHRRVDLPDRGWRPRGDPARPDLLDRDRTPGRDARRAHARPRRPDLPPPVHHRGHGRRRTRRGRDRGAGVHHRAARAARGALVRHGGQPCRPHAVGGRRRGRPHRDRRGAGRPAPRQAAGGRPDRHRRRRRPDDLDRDQPGRGDRPPPRRPHAPRAGAPLRHVLPGHGGHRGRPRLDPGLHLHRRSAGGRRWSRRSWCSPSGRATTPRRSRTTTR